MSTSSSSSLCYTEKSVPMDGNCFFWALLETLGNQIDLIDIFQGNSKKEAMMSLRRNTGILMTCGMYTARLSCMMNEIDAIGEEMARLSFGAKFSDAVLAAPTVDAKIRCCREHVERDGTYASQVEVDVISKFLLHKHNIIVEVSKDNPLTCKNMLTKVLSEHFESRMDYKLVFLKKDGNQEHYNSWISTTLEPVTVENFVRMHRS